MCAIPLNLVSCPVSTGVSAGYDLLKNKGVCETTGRGSAIYLSFHQYAYILILQNMSGIMLEQFRTLGKDYR